MSNPAEDRLNQAQMWNSWHLRHIALDDSPVHLACREDLLRHLPRPGDSGPVLELGSGQGFDAVAIARAGYRVEALDFSPVALEIARKEVAGHSDLQVHYLGRDISLSLPYRAASFSGIYSYLALHYFDTVTTRKIFGEIARVASRECVLSFAVRSTVDPLFGKGSRLGDHYYINEGHVRHSIRLS